MKLNTRKYFNTGSKTHQRLKYNQNRKSQRRLERKRIERELEFQTDKLSIGSRLAEYLATQVNQED